MKINLHVLILHGMGIGGQHVSFAAPTRRAVMSQVIDWAICHTDELAAGSGGEPNAEDRFAHEFTDLDTTREQVGEEEAYVTALGLISFTCKQVTETRVLLDLPLPGKGKPEERHV